MKKEDIVDSLQYLLSEITKNDKEYNWSDNYIYLNTTNEENESDIPVISDPIRFIFKPKAVFCENKKCEKCSNDRQIKTDNTFVTESFMCDCFYDNIDYVVETLIVLFESETCVIIDSNDSYIKIAKDRIMDKFIDNDCSINSIYADELACEECCNYLRGIVNDKQ